MRLRLLPITLLFAASAGSACFSSSSSPPQGQLDASGGSDVNLGEPDAPADVSMSAEGSVDGSVDASAEATTPDGTMADAPVEAAPPDGGTVVDAGDASHADADAALGPGSVTSTSGLALTTFRQEHTATLLASGKVLFCGGYSSPANSLASCDLFDPVANTIIAGPSMSVGRYLHSAALLPNGQVLVAGGLTTNNEIASADVYDPTSNTFTPLAGSMSVTRAEAPALLLSTGAGAGKVLFVGGVGGLAPDASTGTGATLATADLFDPGDASAAQGTFSLLAAHLGIARSQLAAASLPGGGILAVGGADLLVNDNTAETIDAGLGAFAPTANTMSVPRAAASATVLPDGRVFIVGGAGYPATADIYDPTTNSFSSVPLPVPAANQALATLKSGRVMLAGGQSAGGFLGTVLVFDPVTQQFSTASGTLNPPRVLATATTLPDGRVIIAGGQNGAGFIVPAVDIFTE